MTILSFLVLVPCATWLLGSVLGLLDRSDQAAALRRIAWRGLPFLAVAIALGSRALVPATGAVITAFGLHLASATIARTALRRGWITESATEESPGD